MIFWPIFKSRWITITEMYGKKWSREIEIRPIISIGFNSFIAIVRREPKR